MNSGYDRGMNNSTAVRAGETGTGIGRTPRPDIADVHAALAAAERGRAVPTSGDPDIAKAGRNLVLVHM